MLDQRQIQPAVRAAKCGQASLASDESAMARARVRWSWRGLSLSGSRLSISESYPLIASPEPVRGRQGVRSALTRSRPDLSFSALRPIVGTKALLGPHCARRVIPSVSEESRCSSSRRDTRSCTLVHLHLRFLVITRYAVTELRRRLQAEQRRESGEIGSSS